MSRTHITLSALAVALAAALGLQLTLARAPQQRSPDHHAAIQQIDVGEPLPFGLLSIHDRAPVTLSCRVAFVIDPDCGVCRQLASDVSAIQTTFKNALLWLSVSTLARSKWYADMYALHDVYRFDMPDDAEPLSVQRLLNIPVVPTRLIFDQSGLVVDIRITTSLDILDAGDPECHYAISRQ